MAEVERLRQADQVIYENECYGNLYVIDAPALDSMVSQGVAPIVHVGRLDGVRALLEHEPPRWVSVLLWCTRHVAEKRLAERSKDGLTERVAVWDEAVRDIRGQRPGDFHISTTTAKASPQETCGLVVNHLPPE